MTNGKTGTLNTVFNFPFTNGNIESIEINALMEMLLQLRNTITSLGSNSNNLIYGKHVLVNAASSCLIL